VLLWKGILGYYCGHASNLFAIRISLIMIRSCLRFGSRDEGLGLVI